MLGDLGVANEGEVADGSVSATLRGGTPVYASPRVRALFFRAKALPVTERMVFLQKNPITHCDDFFALGATIFDMFAKCGWRRGQSFAETLANSTLLQLLDHKKPRLPVPRVAARASTPAQSPSAKR